MANKSLKPVSFFPAVAWLIVSFILLALPGDDLPHNTLFDIPHFDKIVHLGMFFLLVVTFCFPFLALSQQSTFFKWVVGTTFLAILYGILMEFVQKYSSAGRSFDIIDIIFDSLGAIVGGLAMCWYYGKKIGPDGNQGRNQN